MIIFVKICDEAMHRTPLMDYCFATELNGCSRWSGGIGQSIYGIDERALGVAERTAIIDNREFAVRLPVLCHARQAPRDLFRRFPAAQLKPLGDHLGPGRHFDNGERREGLRECRQRAARSVGDQCSPSGKLIKCLGRNTIMEAVCLPRDDEPAVIIH